MPTQEERLTVLEQSFATFQRETGKAIRELNENATISLGLLHALSQESKQAAFRAELMKLRLDLLETKFDEHTRILNEHTALLNEHTALLNEHTARFDRLEAMLAQVLARLPEKS